MDEIKLKPCPFCGGKAIFDVKSHGTRGSSCCWNYRIACSKCRTHTDRLYEMAINFRDGEIVISYDERTEAVENWNKRAEV